MLDKVKEFVATFSYLGPADVTAMFDLVSLRTYKAGEVVLNAGEVNFNIYFVIKGLLRSHVIKTNGDERTVFLASEGLITASSRTFFMSGTGKTRLSSFLSALPSPTLIGLSSLTYRSVVVRGCASETALR